MAQLTTDRRPARATSASPVDDRLYNILQALTSKLEAIDAYERYALDEPAGVFDRLLEDERRHAVTLLDELRDRLVEPSSGAR
jgi:hypothetical protein